MPWLVVQEENQPPHLVEVSTGTFRIGRRRDNDLVVGDPGASRENSRIEHGGDGWRVVDLRSANGTFLNGQRLPPGEPVPLQPGDELRVGLAVMHFFEKRPGLGRIGASEAAEPGTGDATRVFVANPFVRAPDLVQPAERVRLPEQAQHFGVLHAIAKLLLEATDVEAIGRAALDQLFGVMPVERATIALGDGAGGLTPLIQRTRKGEGQVGLSRTISDWVLREKVAVITSDARHDPRFQRGDSIHAHHVRSAVCAPLWTEAGTEGLIYLDNLFDAHAFDEAELELVTAVANQVALGIRQVRLTEQVRDAAVVRANLSRYHSPDVVEMILDRSREGQSLGVEMVEDVVSVLFADISGFSSLCERLSGVEVAELLSLYYDRMTHLVFRFTGSVNKYIGDAIMATFGAPNRPPNAVELAVRAALAMQVEAEAIRRELPPDRHFQLRVGVNTGRVVVGNIGSLRRLEFTVVGDAVNVAQRIEGICAPGKVYVGRATYEATRDLFRFRDLGDVVVKGRQGAVRVFEVAG